MVCCTVVRKTKVIIGILSKYGSFFAKLRYSILTVATYKITLNRITVDSAEEELPQASFHFLNTCVLDHTCSMSMVGLMFHPRYMCADFGISSIVRVE